MDDREQIRIFQEAAEKGNLAQAFYQVAGEFPDSGVLGDHETYVRAVFVRAMHAAETVALVQHLKSSEIRSVFPTVSEVRKELENLGPRGAYMARSDITDILEAARKIMEAR